MLTKNTKRLNSLIYGSLITLTILDGSASQREDENEESCCCLPFLFKQRNVRQELEPLTDLAHPHSDFTSGKDYSLDEGSNYNTFGRNVRNYGKATGRLKKKAEQENDSIELVTIDLIELGSGVLDSRIKEYVKDKDLSDRLISHKDSVKQKLINKMVDKK